MYNLFSHEAATWPSRPAGTAGDPLTSLRHSACTLYGIGVEASFPISQIDLFCFARDRLHPPPCFPAFFEIVGILVLFFILFLSEVMKTAEQCLIDEKRGP
jgi:hypothetical protein